MRAPVVLVPKKDGGTRLTVDYRKLNGVTRADRYALPRINNLLHEAKGSGYHQIKIKPSDRDKTTFVTDV